MRSRLRGRVAAMGAEDLLGRGQVGLAVPHLIVAGCDFDFDGAIGIGRPARIGIVGETILRAQLAVDAIEDGAKLLRGIRIKHRATGGVGHRLESVFTGGVAAIFVFHGPDNDGVKEHIRADGLPASGVEVVMAGGFSGVRDKDNDAGETTSHYDFDAARREAVSANVLLYTIVIRPVKNENGRNTAGEHALETMTDTTGGAMFYPDTPQELGAIFDRIDRELRTQYRLAYYPNPRGPANTYRSIEVKVTTGNYQVRHRKSYLTAPQ